MTIEIISRSISTKVWDRAGIDGQMDGWMDKPKTIELHKPINPCVKFGSNLVINGRVSTKCKVKGGSHFVSHLSYRSLDKTHIPT